MQGSVTQVVSRQPHDWRQGMPDAWHHLRQPDIEGGDKPINARITQVSEKSDTAGDTAKIAGGAVAGGVIGHQISHKNGSVIAAIIGAAAWTARAEEDRQGSRASRRDRGRHDTRVAGHRHDVTSRRGAPHPG